MSNQGSKSSPNHIDQEADPKRIRNIIEEIDQTGKTSKSRGISETGGDVPEDNQTPISLTE